MLHESAHHLEQTDEAFVKLAVAEVMRLWKRTRQPDEIALRTALCDRLADYYLLLTHPERSHFVTTCNAVTTLKVYRVQKMPPYDAVMSVDVSFSLRATLEDMNVSLPVRDFYIQGIANLSRVENQSTLKESAWRVTHMEDAWRVAHMSVHSRSIRDELNDFFAILDEKPKTVKELMRKLDPRIHVLAPENRQSFLIYDSAFPRPHENGATTNAFGNQAPVLNEGSQLIVFTTATGKWWPLAYTSGTKWGFEIADYSVIKPEATPVYTTARLVAPFIDKEPGVELMPYSSTRYKPEMITVNWNHLAFLGPGPFNLRPYSAAAMSIEETKVQDALRKLRMAPVLGPDPTEFEALVKEVDEMLISMKSSMETQPVLKAEMREIHAQYFLRRARVERGDGFLAFLNYMGSEKDVLRYGLTHSELQFLVLRSLDTYLKTEHNIPLVRRLSSFEENLEMLGWRFETLEVTRQQVDQVVRRDDAMRLKFYFYDQAQALLKKWRESVSTDDTGMDWVVQNYLAELERDLGLTAADVGITAEAIEDSLRVANLIEAYQILQNHLLPKMQKGYSPSPKDVAEIAYWAGKFRRAVNASFYTAEYLYVSKDPFPSSAEPGRNEESWIEHELLPTRKPDPRRIAKDKKAALEDLQNRFEKVHPKPQLEDVAGAAGALRRGARSSGALEYVENLMELPLDWPEEKRNLAVGRFPRFASP
ncbi:MAG: hypothetical protein R3B54_10560 [Bdellovibrionota bacterium]